MSDVKKEIKEYIKQLQADNTVRSEKIKTAVPRYHTALVHQYNLTLDITKKLNEIIK